MTEKLIKYYYPGIVFYLFICYLAVFFKLDILKELFLLIVFLFSFIVALKAYKKSTNVAWIIFSLAALSRILSKGYEYFYIYLLKFNINTIIITNIFYLFPSILLMIGCLIYIKRFLSNINLVQLLIDTIAISLICFIIFWFIVLKSNLSVFISSTNDIILFIYLILDFITLTITNIGLMSIEKVKDTKFTHITFFGISLYAYVDLFLSYKYYCKLPIPTFVTSILFSFSFIIISLGGLYCTRNENTNNTDSLTFNTNFISRRAKDIFLLSPILFYAILRGANIQIFVATLFIFLVYKLISSYVKNAIKNEQLLDKERALNSLLEKMVNERSKELLLKNDDLQYLSDHDFITNIYNVRYLNHYIDSIIDKKNPSSTIVLFYIDVDRFKPINDIYGHDIGDKLLIEIASRLLILSKAKGIAARIGGDEFIIAYTDNLTSKEIESVATKIIDACSKPIQVEAYEFTMAISVGIAMFPKDANTRMALIKNADMAMYDSKANGGNKYSLFNSSLINVILDKHETELLLKTADFATEFKLFYQPQIDIINNKLVGMEALIRWNSPTKGNIPPNKFIKIAEEIGFMDKIGEFVMNTAAFQISTWNRKYKQNLKIGINVSPNQLDSVNFTKKLQAFIEKYELEASWIDIEITENVAMKGEATLRKIFSILHNMGVSTSIDDFGTGYSSLSYIQQFSFNRIKIAKELIDDMTTDVNRSHIIKAIITMADALNITTIAEGIETKEQLDLIKSLGCNEVQGYFYSKPLPAFEFEKKFLDKIK